MELLTNRIGILLLIIKIRFTALVMSYFLFKSYCYETIDQASNAVYSSFELPFGVIQSVTPNGSTLSISYLHQNQNQTELSSSTFNYSLATCDKLGFDNSFSGLTKKDSVDISAAIVAVLIAAYAAKIVRRAL